MKIQAHFLQLVLSDDVINIEKYPHLPYEESAYRLVAYHLIKNYKTNRKIPVAKYILRDNGRKKNDIYNEDVNNF